MPTVSFFPPLSVLYCPFWNMNVAFHQWRLNIVRSNFGITQWDNYLLGTAECDWSWSGKRKKRATSDLKGRRVRRHRRHHSSSQPGRRSPQAADRRPSLSFWDF